MKNSKPLSVILALIITCALYANLQGISSGHLTIKKKAAFHLPDPSKLMSGDIIFQTTQSDQCKAIQLATQSPYTHCGLIYKEGDEVFVFEAVQPVKRTSLKEWIARGKDGKYVIKRLKDADRILTPSTLTKMKLVGEGFAGKDYDINFEWSDDQIYCSELVWKIYQRAAGIEVGKLEKLSDFDLSSETVQQIMHERYGNDVPLEQIVVSPASIFNSSLLITVEH